MTDDKPAAESAEEVEPEPDPDQPGSMPASPQDATAGTPSAEAGSTRMLEHFMQLSPCMDLYVKYFRPCPDETDRHHKIKMICLGIDMTLRVLAALVLLAIMTGIAYKTLFPLPGLTH